MQVFNWSNAPPELCWKAGVDKNNIDLNPGPDSHRQAFFEIGSPQNLMYKDKFFAVDRRGGYPWADGYLGKNDDMPLPLNLDSNGSPADLTIMIGDNLRAYSDNIENVILRAIFFNAQKDDQIQAKLNGITLDPVVRDFNWKDPQIFSPKPQPASGGASRWNIDPNQKLLRIDFTVSPQLCKLPQNQVQLQVTKRAKDTTDSDIVLEKLEVHIDYE